MKKLFSYMICVVGLVFVMCGSAGASDVFPLVVPDGTVFTLDSDSSGLLSNYSVAPFSISGLGGSLWGLNPSNSEVNRSVLYDAGWSSSNTNLIYRCSTRINSTNTPAKMAICFFISLQSVDGYNSPNADSIVINGFDLSKTANYSSGSFPSNYSVGWITEEGSIFSSNHFYWKFMSDFTQDSIDLSGGVLVNSVDPVSIPYAPGPLALCLFWIEDVPQQSSTTRFFTMNYSTSSDPFVSVHYKEPDPPTPPDWIQFLPAYALDETLVDVLNEVKKISVSSGTPSPMDKFESDYIQNFDNQLSKTEEYIGSDSPVIPGNFVTSGSDGSPSMVDSLKDGMGLSNSSFDSQAFQDASQAFSGPDSTSEGGMWWFFTQEIADALEATNSNSREGDTVDAWISDSDRRWSIWGW